ncbi:MAG TPA: CaiB/BaiF CoA-transferase family protein [Acidimicrobiales bacterium]|nr:CaiB/BaiF CoA-transferase family protein [Acidimicrobiales bacterium]
MSGPLTGIRVIELAGLGPGPYACMLLADAGADVIRLERAPAGGVPWTGGPYWDLLNRSRPSVGVDLKRPEAVGLLMDLVEQADILIEGFRPGVAERLGIGPEQCWARNAKLVYGRMTGWGQDGPLASAAGHDIDYIAISGALGLIGRAGERPVPPLNLVGDFGGGGMMLAFGVLAALLESQRSGQGQVVDAAMTDGSASLITMMFAFRLLGSWKEERGVNMLDTGAPYYEVYETADGQYFAVGAIERQFYAELLKGLGLDADDLPDPADRDRWPELKERFAAVFRTRTRDEWAAVFDGTDACAAPVLSAWEAPDHPHNKARGTYVEVDGVVQPGPAPRFSRTASVVSRPPSPPGADTTAALAAWGVSEEAMAKLREAGAIS